MISLQSGTGTTNNGGRITIQAGNGGGSGATYWEVKTRTHDIILEKLSHCKTCGHEFILSNDYNLIWTGDKSIKDLTCNEVIMKDVIE